MDRAEDGRLRFFSELSEHQISADEFFNVVLLDSLARNFGLQNVLISYFDPQGNFLSWTHRNGVLADCEEHPYRRCQPADVVRQTLYREAVQDKLTYNNVTPRLYHSTKLIPPEDYEQSSYVRFLEENFGARYSVTMAFGINAYIQVAFFKSREEGDFTPEELSQLEQIYVYIANDYKNFKKYEQAKIISNIQSEIILSGEKAYLVTDDFMHIMSCNHAAKVCLDDILGGAADGLDGSRPCSWLPFCWAVSWATPKTGCRPGSSGTIFSKFTPTTSAIPTALWTATTGSPLPGRSSLRQLAKTARPCPRAPASP